MNTVTYLKEKKIERGNIKKNRYHSMSEGIKQRLKEYQKNMAWLKSLNIIMNKLVF